MRRYVRQEVCVNCESSRGVMSNRNWTLKNFMSEKDRKSLGNRPTWHSHCMKKTGVARPGKTARDRARRNRSAQH